MSDLSSMMDLSYLASTGVGGCVVGAIARTHLHFIWRELNYQRQWLIELQKEVVSLQRRRGEGYQGGRDGRED